jgi:hypothetical protein
MKNLLLFILLACSSNFIKAQDTLTIRSGENVIVKIIEVGSSEVKYKKIDNLNGPVFAILKSELYLIRYENGSKDDFSNIGKAANTQELYTQGYNDALKYYKSYKVTGNTVLLASSFPFYGFIFGGAAAALTSSAEPSDENLDYPDLSLMKYEYYAKGYKTAAKNIKRKKILTNFLTGLAISIGSSVAIAVALSPH